MDELDELRDKYKDDKEFNYELYKYLTFNLPKDKYKDFVEEFVPLMHKYNIDEEIKDTIVAMILYDHMNEFIKFELPKCVYNALHGKIPLDVITERLSNSIEFLNNKEALKLLGLTQQETKGFNDGIKSRISLFEHVSTIELIQTLIHESLHQVTHYEAKDNDNKVDLLAKKSNIYKFSNKSIHKLVFSGVSVSYQVTNKKQTPEEMINNKNGTIWIDNYIKLNEAITEYLTKKVMGDLYPKTDKNAGYNKEVAILEELIEDDILDEETIINAYVSNSVAIILNKLKEKNIDKSILDRFTNGYIPKKVSQSL